MSDKFNDIFKSKLEHHEVPADHLWNSIASQIPASNTGFWKPWMSGVSAAAGTVAIATMTWLGFKTDNQSVEKTAAVKTEVTQATPSTKQQDSQTVPTIAVPEQTVSTQIEIVQAPSEFDSELILDEYSPMVNQDPILSQTDLNAFHQEVPPQSNNTVGAPAEERVAELSAYFTIVVSDAEELKYFFFAAQTGADAYNWYLSNGEVSESFQTQSFSYSFEQEGEYQLSLRVSANGKERYQSQVVKVYRPAIINPVNAFAPGYDGLNDVFDALADARNVQDVSEFIITDTNGKVVHQQEHGALWDGRINGEWAQPGRYLWTIEYTDNFGKVCVKRGSLQLFAE
jgi:gliding motility-associated-like protein